MAHEFLEKEGMFESEFVFLSCGDFDGRHMRREAEVKGLSVPSYLKRWINLKKVFPSPTMFDLSNLVSENEEKKSQSA